MRNLFYPKLAAINIRNHAQTYIPYFLTCIGTFSLFYIMLALSQNEDLGSPSLNFILLLGSIVIGFFAVIFLFYTHSFLIKRRKKEFGLFNILGMEKKHISKILLWETIYTAIIGFVIGTAFGILLSKLLHLLLLKILHFDVQMGISISMEAIITSIILFGAIFFLNFLNTLRQIHLSNPIELLHGSQTGEKEPKTKWLLTLIGVICLGIGYFIAITTESPMDALVLFFVAVILVIIGTYCLFTAGSIALLKLLRKNKKFYYQTRHFTSVSGMMYRMKQNAVGLANICILATAVLVILSSTTSLYGGMEDVLRTRYPRNTQVSASNITEEQALQLQTTIESQAKSYGVTIDNKFAYRSQYLLTVQDGDFFKGEFDGFYDNSVSALICMDLDEFNKMTEQSFTLAPGEVYVMPLRGNIEGNSIQIGERSFSVKEQLEPIQMDGSILAMMINSYCVVFPDESYIQDAAYDLSDGEESLEGLSYYYGFDMDADAETQIALTHAIENSMLDMGLDSMAENVEESRNSFYELYGGLFFLGLFLGTLFIMATVLIIYYKQITEGYEDKKRFEIMQKVGMSHAEVKKAIHSQVMTVFFLPLIAAGIHIAFAFKLITRLLAILNLTNVSLFALCMGGTLLVFAVFYAIVYGLTAKVYYKIVSS